MATLTPPRHQFGNAYNAFILILTAISLLIMLVMFLPLNDASINLLRFYDNLICFIFLIDFFIRLFRSSRMVDYLIKDNGWLDLVGAIPALGSAFKYSGLFRLARVSRGYKIARQFGRTKRGDLLRELLNNRSQYTGIFTVLLAIIILSASSVLVLQFESGAPDAKIVNEWDAFWYSIVTITTVGYGDYYPVTAWGRIVGMFIMVSGVGIIGALASLMSSFLIGEQKAPEQEEPGQMVSIPGGDPEVIALREELIAQRKLLEQISTQLEDIQKNKKNV